MIAWSELSRIETRTLFKISLRALENCAQSGKGNLLEFAIKAARNRATLGEITTAMEKHFGRYQANTQMVSGAYATAMKQDEIFQKAKDLANTFSALDGRRPRIMVAKLGQDGHDRGAKVIATSFADIGFDVDIGPLFQTPEEAARQAIENDVHILGVSSLAAGHKNIDTGNDFCIEKIWEDRIFWWLPVG